MAEDTMGRGWAHPEGCGVARAGLPCQAQVERGRCVGELHPSIHRLVGDKRVQPDKEARNLGLVAPRLLRLQVDPRRELLGLGVVHLQQEAAHNQDQSPA